MIPLHILLYAGTVSKERVITANLDPTRIDLNDGTNYRLGVWNRGFSEYRARGYTDAEEEFTIDILGDTYQTVQTNLRKLELTRSIARERADSGETAYDLFVLPSGYTDVYTVADQYDPPPGTFAAQVKQIDIKLPSDETLLSELKGIARAVVRVTRGPWYATTPVSPDRTLVSGIAPFVVNYFLLPTQRGAEDVTPYYPYFPRTYLRPTLGSFQNSTTPSGMIILNDADVQVLNQGFGTGFNTVSDATARGGTVVRKSSNFVLNERVTYPFVSYVVALPARPRSITTFATVWASGGSFMLQTLWSTGSNDDYLSDSVYVPQSPGPIVTYVGHIALPRRVLATNSDVRLVATSTTSGGNLYVDTLTICQDEGNLRAIVLEPNNSTGIDVLQQGFVDPARPLFAGSYVYAPDGFALFYLDENTDDYIVPGYYGSPQFIAESENVYAAYLFTSGNAWTATTSGGTPIYFTVSGAYYPSYSYFPRM